MINLILDFDGTLTEKDTLAVLSRTALPSIKARLLSRSPPAHEPVSNRLNLPQEETTAEDVLSRRWSAIVSAYLSSYSAHVSTYSPARKERRTVSEEVVWLNSLGQIESASFNRATTATSTTTTDTVGVAATDGETPTAVLDRVTRKDVEDLAKKAICGEGEAGNSFELEADTLEKEEEGRVKLRKGWAELLIAVEERNLETSQKLDSLTTEGVEDGGGRKGSIEEETITKGTERRPSVHRVPIPVATATAPTLSPQMAMRMQSRDKLPWISIVSVNWSRCFVSNVLSHAARNHERCRRRREGTVQAPTTSHDTNLSLNTNIDHETSTTSITKEDERGSSSPRPPDLTKTVSGIAVYANELPDILAESREPAAIAIANANANTNGKSSPTTSTEPTVSHAPNAEDEKKTNQEQEYTRGYPTDLKTSGDKLRQMQKLRSELSSRTRTRTRVRGPARARSSTARPSFESNIEEKQREKKREEEEEEEEEEHGTPNDEKGEERENESDDGMFTIYVGDSSTDLECLLAADLGICIRDEPMGSGQRDLAETCQRIDVDVGHVSKFVVDGELSMDACTHTTETTTSRIHKARQKEKKEMKNEKEEWKWKRKRKRLWWARDLDEVRELVESLP